MDEFRIEVCASAEWVANNLLSDFLPADDDGGYAQDIIWSVWNETAVELLEDAGYLAGSPGGSRRSYHGWNGAIVADGMAYRGIITFSTLDSEARAKLQDIADEAHFIASSRLRAFRLE